jgi:hypothetical protein
VAKAAKAPTGAPSTYTALVCSNVDFSTNVLLADVKRQATPVTPGTAATLKPHLLWKSPFAALNRTSSNIRILHKTDIVLASSQPLDVLEFYRKLVAATKPAEIDLVPILAFDPLYALWPHNLCADIIFEMNDALALRLDQTGTPNLEDEIIHILYQKHILDSSSGVRASEFLHALLKKEKRQLNYKMPTLPDLDKATSIGYFGANIKRYYLQVQAMGVYFYDKTKSRFFLSALQQKGIEVDQLLDCLDNVSDADTSTEELTIIELVLRIKYIHSLQNSFTAVIDQYVHPTNDRDSSNPRHNHQSSSSDLRPPHSSSSDARPVSDFRTRINTQCICGGRGHSVENCQQMSMHFLVAKYLQKDTNITPAAEITKEWRLANEKYSQSARSTVRAIRAILPEDMAGRTDDEIMEKL